MDVDYRADHAQAACILFRNWTDECGIDQWVQRIDEVEKYQPGQFYRRELPCLLAVLEKIAQPPAAVVIDGYVWLDANGRPGLGARLFEALHRATPVIGVAKTAFRGSDFAIPVIRAGSKRPLFVTAAGLDARQAAGHIATMHGESRIPTLLKQVDRVCRQLAP